MLTRFEVKGFKSLVDVSVDLGAVNVFIGANGSGKSNLLEALGVLAAVASGHATDESFRYRGVRSGYPSAYFTSLRDRVQDHLLLSATDARVLYQVELKANEQQSTQWKIEHESIYLDGKITLQRTQQDSPGADPEDSSLVTLAELADLKETMSIGGIVLGLALLRSKIVSGEMFRSSDLAQSNWKNQFIEFDRFFYLLSKFAIFCPATPQLRGLLDDIHRDPVGIGGSGIDKALDEMLSTETDKLGPYELEDVFNLIEWADQIAVLPSRAKYQQPSNRLRLADRYLANDKRFISASEVSEGSLYVLLILILAGHKRSPKSFAIDNFDQALHPRLARELTSLICHQIVADGTRQMLATTHNPLVLDGLNLLDDRIRLFAVDRDETGATKIERVMVTQKLLDLADAGMSLSRLWTMGRLGGTPENF